MVGNVGLGILGDPTRGDRQNDVLTYGVSFARALTQACRSGRGDQRPRRHPRTATRRRAPSSRSVARFGGRYTIGAWRADAAVLFGLTVRRTGDRLQHRVHLRLQRVHGAVACCTKAHAYGNDFLLAPTDEVADPAAAARTLCDRHSGIGGDGLILYTLAPARATMTLFNADGSPSELSGNGLRCLAALVARVQGLTPGSTVTVDTGAGVKTLDLLNREAERYTFRAALGAPADIRQVQIPVLGEVITASVLNMGNPQCVVLGPLPDRGRFDRFGPALSTHAMFAAGSNVEFAHVESPDRVRILIWERGVGPTTSSGTGAAASAVAAAAHGGAARRVDIVAPGGTQRVEWLEDGVHLTGWAELVANVELFRRT